MRRLLPIATFILLLLATPMLASAKATEKHRSTYCWDCPRDAHGRIKRSSGVRRTFLKSKDLTHTPKGCQVDHIVPLSKGGADSPSNMQLLCGEALKAKERSERK